MEMTLEEMLEHLRVKMNRIELQIAAMAKENTRQHNLIKAIAEHFDIDLRDAA